MSSFLKIKALFVCLLIVNFVFSQDWTERLKITANERTKNASFGTSVAISGDFAVVGANQEPKDADNSEENIFINAGAAYVFKNENGQWEFYQKIVSSDRSSGDYFGNSVAIDGDYIVVGAQKEAEDENGQNTKPNAGSAYIFQNIDGDWTEIQKICASDRSNDDLFGTDVGISQNNIIVSAYQQGSDENGENLKNNSGSVYAFTKQGNTWVQTQKIVASDRSDADFFGYSIDIDKNYLVVGAYLQDYNSTGASYIMDAGAAYVYKKEGETWTEKQKLTAGDRKTESYFGYSVSISGDYIIVGAYKHSENSNLNQSGVAYIFKNNSDNWQEQTKLKSSDLTANDYFGKSVAIDGTYALVGADLQDNDENGENFSFNAGAAYLFKLENNNWTETQKLCASDRSGSAAYGFKLAIHDYNFIVCANQEDYDVNGENYLNNSGSAYIYRKNSNLIVKKGNEIINNEQTLNFGNLIFEEEFQEINISFSNDGGDIIKFTDEEIFVLQGNDIEDFSLEFDENLDTLLMPNTTAYLNIKFSPTSLGLKNAELLINNDTEQSEFLILLKGNGILLSKLSNINSNILVFPNPGNSQIFIDLKDTEADIINIYDANAKCVISKTNAKGLINIDTSNLQTGVYLLSIISDNTIVNSKFIIE